MCIYHYRFDALGLRFSASQAGLGSGRIQNRELSNLTYLRLQATIKGAPHGRNGIRVDDQRRDDPEGVYLESKYQAFFT